MARLHIANAFFEEELAESSVPTPYRAMHSHSVYLQLQYLPYLYANPTDGIAVSDLPDDTYDDVLRKWNLPCLDRYVFEQHNIPSYTQIESWGPSRSIKQWAEQHGISYEIPPWHLVKEVNAKSFSFQHSSRLPGAMLLNHEEEAQRWLSNTLGPKVLKTCFGLSGKGHLLIDATTPQEKIWHLLRREWELGRGVIAEPWVKRICDFSTQWEIHSDRSIVFMGSTICINNARGQYVANRVGEETLLFGSYLPYLDTHKAAAQSILCTLARLGYFGNVGFDAMIYQLSDSQAVQLHPIVEINARKTMGWASIVFQRNFYPHCQLTFRFSKGTEGLLPSSIQLSNGKKVVFKHNLTVNLSQ